VRAHDGLPNTAHQATTAPVVAIYITFRPTCHLFSRDSSTRLRDFLLVLLCMQRARPSSSSENARLLLARDAEPTIAIHVPITRTRRLAGNLTPHIRHVCHAIPHPAFAIIAISTTTLFLTATTSTPFHQLVNIQRNALMTIMIRTQPNRHIHSSAAQQILR
jgi:hypothetical protein